MIIQKSIEHAGKAYAFMTPEQLREVGVPEAVITEAINAARVEALKAICKTRIYARASAETQANMTFAIAFISSKTAAQRSAQETAMLAKAPAVLDWVNAMRANVQTLATDPELDAGDDANWPVPAQDALDLVALF